MFACKSCPHSSCCALRFHRRAGPASAAKGAGATRRASTGESSPRLCAFESFVSPRWSSLCRDAVYCCHVLQWLHAPLCVCNHIHLPLFASLRGVLIHSIVSLRPRFTARTGLWKNYKMSLRMTLAHARYEKRRYDNRASTIASFWVPSSTSWRSAFKTLSWIDKLQKRAYRGFGSTQLRRERRRKSTCKRWQ